MSVFSVIFALIMRYVRFVTLVAIVAAIGIVATHGWSWFTTIIIFAILLFLLFAYALAWFWHQVFHTRSEERNS